MSTAILWYRNDLRLHDYPALQAALAEADEVVPVFIFDEVLLAGPHASANRSRFLIECLADLRASLQQRGADLLVRRGRPAQQLRQLIRETSATSLYFTADVSPYASRRDRAIKADFEREGIAVRRLAGRLAVDDLDSITNAAGRPLQIFTPFWKRWEAVPRRPLAPVPKAVPMPSGLDPGDIPEVHRLGSPGELAPHVLPGGESAARARLDDWLAEGIHRYHEYHDDLAADATSRLSAYLHFGCISVREIEEALPPGEGPAAFHRQLAWRDFYHYILRAHPGNAREEFQERYRGFDWQDEPALLAAWQAGRTGYPVVDAAMRQLLQEGYMHNRARLIVGSFLTKDLGLDWREGEQYFMRHLVDGDEANNNGNWQWIASVGVDPAPVFRRLYNPTKQQERFDPTGAYVRRYVPELANVPLTYLSAPHTMPSEVQQTAGCLIGHDYPEPIVDHAQARQAALERYRRS